MYVYTQYTYTCMYIHTYTLIFFGRHANQRQPAFHSTTHTHIHTHICMHRFFGRHANQRQPAFYSTTHTHTHTHMHAQILW